MHNIILTFALLTASVLASANQAGIATAHPQATKAGADIINNGGNAFDAAVAITAALGVVEPYSSGIGGGGFYLMYLSKEKRTIFLDARERAPFAGHSDMYLDDQKNVIAGSSVNGPLAAGIPGIPAALDYLSKKYGKNTLAENLASSIELAEKGFNVDEIYRRLAEFRLPVLTQYPHSNNLFLINGKVPQKGALIKQQELANTLRHLARNGRDGFYKGEVAAELIKSVKQNGGIWQQRDLDSYVLVERSPITLKMDAGTLYSAPPPSSGGVAIVQILQQLKELDAQGKSKQQQQHLLIETMRRSYRDRAIYLGDTDFVKVPLNKLLSQNYAAGLAASINPEKASKSTWFSAKRDGAGGNHTTHFSVVDKQGNIISATLSINYPFGSGFVAGNTGVLLNDEMDDFVAKPDVPNVYGLVGGKANAIEGGKRMLSSMSPSILVQPNRTVVLGTPGGSRIITMVLNGLLLAMQGASAKEIVEEKRIHHQFLPDTVFFEKDVFNKEEEKYLKDKGHVLQMNNAWGNMQTVIVYNNGKTNAASDSRGIGTVWTSP